jgi:NAD(P)-dependent dehydrogenase (short-subunit alcohol dehydrogenase family)
MDEHVERSVECVLDLAEDARKVVVGADVALRDEGGVDGRSEVANVPLDPLALVREREPRAAVRESLRDRPRDRALVGDAENERALAREIGRHPAILWDAYRLRVPQVAVVTGASSGIGAEVARALARTGRLCVLLARREERLRALAEEIDGEFEICDVRDRVAVADVAGRVLERHPRIDVLVNNAGVPGRTGFLDGDPDRIENVIRTNYLGGVWCLRAFLPGLLAAAPSDVVNVVSVAGDVAFPPSGPYSASKHAQLAFSRATAAQLRARRIRVHTIKPGFVETEGFPQGWLPWPARRLVVGPEVVASHVVRSLEQGRGETSVPRYYGVAGRLQALAPNTLARLLGSKILP